MPLTLPTGAETTHGQVRQKYNDSLTYLDEKPSGGGSGGDYYLSGNANYIPTFDAIEDAPISDAISVIEVGGRVTEGDCKPFRMYVGGAGVAETWFGKWSTTSAAGTGATARNWTYKIDGDELWFEQSGAPHDTYDSDAIACGPWMDATIAFLRAHRGGAQPLMSLSTLWMTHSQDAGGWFWATVIDLTGGRFNMRGHGVGKTGGSPTVMRWGWATTGGAGIIIDNIGTIGGAPRPGGANLDGADGTLIDGLMLWHSGYNNEPDSPNAVGIFARGRFILSNCRFIDWDSSGLSIYADVQQPATRGNANCFLVSACSFESCRGFGVEINGADANAGMLMNNTAIACWQGGVADKSFLGNDHYNWHIETSPQLKTQVDTSSKPPVYVAHNGGPVPGLYFCIVGQETAASTTEPGTNPEVWELIYASGDPESEQVPWVSGMTVRSGGTVVTANNNNRARFWGVYCEGGIKVPAQINGRAYLQFSTNEVGVSRQSLRTGAVVEWDNLRMGGGYKTHSYDDDTNLDTSTRLGVEVGGGRRNVLSWYRGVNGVDPVTFWQIKSLQNGSYGITTDFNSTRNQYESGFFMGPNDSIGNNHNSDAGFFGSIHIRYFRLGERGVSRAFGYNDIPQSGNTGRGDHYREEQPVLGGHEGWTTVKGKNDAGGAVVKPSGYVPWKGSQAITPGTVPANDVVGGNITLSGVSLGDFIDCFSYNQALGDCSLDVKVNGTNSIRWTISNPTGSGIAISAGTVWFMVKLWSQFS